MRVVAIVLAAGSSSRLGRPKQLLPLAGRPVLQHVLDAAAASPVDHTILVLGHEAEEIRGAVSIGPLVRVIVNEDHGQGASTSLRAGLRAARPGFDAAVILLGDQPQVRPEAIGTVVEAHRRGAGPAVQASYGGIAAHPTLLSRSIWEDVMAEATGDVGARRVLASHPEWRATAEVGGDPPQDIDTEADYERLRAILERPGGGSPA